MTVGGEINAIYSRIFLLSYQLFWRRIAALIWKLSIPLTIKSPCLASDSDNDWLSPWNSSSDCWSTHAIERRQAFSVHNFHASGAARHQPWPFLRAPACCHHVWHRTYCTRWLSPLPTESGPKETDRWLLMWSSAVCLRGPTTEKTWN